MFEDKIIKDINKKEISFKQFRERLLQLRDEGYKFYIGTDSQTFKDYIKVVTCICAHKHSVGADGYYIKKRVSKEIYPTLRARMSMEAFDSIEAGFYFQEMLGGSDISIHLDIGSDPNKNATAFLVGELTGMVLGQGFDVKIKPYSWASDIADKFTK